MMRAALGPGLTQLFCASNWEDQDSNYLAIVVAAFAVFVLAPCTTARSPRDFATLNPAYSGSSARMAPWKIGVELIRNVVLALVIACLVDLTGMNSWASGATLGALLWVGFPVVLWTGAVIWEKGSAETRHHPCRRLAAQAAHRQHHHQRLALSARWDCPVGQHATGLISRAWGMGERRHLQPAGRTGTSGVRGIGVGPRAQDADVESAFDSDGSYPDAVLRKLVAAVAKRAHQTPGEALQWFGRHSMPLLALRYPTFFASQSSTRSFVLTLNDIIHPEVRRLYPQGNMPNFSSTLPLLTS